MIDETVVDEFERLAGQLGAAYEEFSALASKKPDSAVSVFKISVLNPLLVRTNTLLGSTSLPIVGFTVFSADDLPVNSDIVLVLSQYMEALEKFRSDHVRLFLGEWYWFRHDPRNARPGDDGFVRIRKTIRPKRLKEPRS